MERHSRQTASYTQAPCVASSPLEDALPRGEVGRWGVWSGTCSPVLKGRTDTPHPWAGRLHPGRQHPPRACAEGGPGAAGVTEVWGARPPSHRTRPPHRREPSQRKRLRPGRALQTRQAGEGRVNGAAPQHRCWGHSPAVASRDLSNRVGRVSIINNASCNLHFSN